MATISATVVRKPLGRWTCDGGASRACERLITGPHLRLYGYAQRGDPPYVVRVCVPCASLLTFDPKAAAALAELRDTPAPGGEDA